MHISKSVLKAHKLNWLSSLTDIQIAETFKPNLGDVWHLVTALKSILLDLWLNCCHQSVWVHRKLGHIHCYC